MPPHDEPDQLSAYIDGELEEPERARIDAHLPGCPECRTTLDALRATLTDLGTLPEPAPSEQDSWAVRSALARARRPSKRWQRAALAAGTVAAGLIAVLAVTHNNATTHKTFDATAAGEGSAASVPILTSAKNFDAQSAQAYLLDVSGVVPGANVPAENAPGAAAPTPAYKNQQRAVPLSTSGRTEFSALSADSSTASQIDRCVRVVKRSTQELLNPVQYGVVSFESKPAFFLIFSTTSRYELWVVTRTGCDVLYFAQAV